MRAPGFAGAVALLAAGLSVGGCGSTQHQKQPVRTGLPPVIGDPLIKPYRGTLLLHIIDAGRVRVCFTIPASSSARRRTKEMTMDCRYARLLTSLPSSYPVQSNLLEIFPKGVWLTIIPTAARDHYPLNFAVTAYRSGWAVANAFTLRL